MRVTMAKKRKKGFNFYTFAIILCIIIILASLWVIFRPDKLITPYGLEVIKEKFSKNEEISENDARKLAVKQFEKMGENVAQDSLEVIKLQRNDGLYYYISSEKNTLEIRIKGGEITRINAVPVKE